MKAIRPFLIVAAVLVLLASPVVLYYPIHDLLGLWNTSYSDKFSPERFTQVSVGMSRTAVVELLGSPLDSHTLTNYPAWALRDDGVRAHYSKDAELQIETLSFSRPKRGGDYDMVSVWIGPDTNVIQHERWVTD
jgi:hypothetical protein